MQTMKYKGYTGSIEASLEDGCLHGEILFINDLIIYEGATVKQIEASFHKSVDTYLESCKKRGKEPNRPYSGTFNVRLDPELHRQAAEAALSAGQSLNQWVAYTIRAAVGSTAPAGVPETAQQPVAVNQILMGNAQQAIPPKAMYGK